MLQKNPTNSNGILCSLQKHSWSASIIDSSPPPKKLLEPTLQFAQKYLSDERTASGEKILVPELVHPGRVLADFPNLEQYRGRGFEKGPLRAGNHTIFSDDGDSLLAAVIGYPKVTTLTDENEGDIPVISVVPLVKVSFDKLSASLTIYPPLPDFPGLRTDNIGQLLDEAGIRHGLDESAIERAKLIVAAARAEISELVIANGSMPGEGRDARLEYIVEIGPIAGTLLEGGRIDFRERRIMVGVKADQLIAKKSPAIPGTPGTNVLGEIIESKSGKDIKIRTIGDCKYSEETQEIRVTRDGLLSAVNDNTIQVSSRHTVSGDVDFSTGNIQSEGCLIVRGSVQPGFVVESNGDLEVGGSLMSARVTCGANVVIKGGITGKTSEVAVAGDADITFIEQGQLNAGGIVVVRKQAYFSRIKSQSDIRFHPSSKIMGGSVVAAGHLTVGSVGSENSESALLAAGVDPERLNLYHELKKELKDQQNEIIQWLQLHGNARSRKVRKMEAVVDETRQKLLSLNLIPGTELHSRIGTGASREEIEEQNPLYHAGLDVDKIRIDIHEDGYPGTRLLLGNRSMVLERVVSKRQFKLSGDMKRIIALPLRTGKRSS